MRVRVRVREAGRQRRESKAVGERSGKQAPEGEKSQESRGVREGEGRGGSTGRSQGDEQHRAVQASLWRVEASLYPRRVEGAGSGGRG